VIPLLLLACAHPAPGTSETDPGAPFAAAERGAARLVRDPARGGAPLSGDASPLPPFRGVDRAVDTYVGPSACAGCHAAEHAVWSASAHAHAHDALAPRGAFDPRCFRCHVSGFGSPGGYPAGGLDHVSCEACHGPASGHLARVAAGGSDPGWGALPADARACVACHTWENSPDFTWDGYWPAVAHGPRVAGAGEHGR